MSEIYKERVFKIDITDIDVNCREEFRDWIELESPVVFNAYNESIDNDFNNELVIVTNECVDNMTVDAAFDEEMEEYKTLKDIIIDDLKTLIISYIIENNVAFIDTTFTIEMTITEDGETKKSNEETINLIITNQDITVRQIIDILYEAAEEAECDVILESSTNDLYRNASYIYEKLQNDSSKNLSEIIDDEIAMYFEEKN